MADHQLMAAHHEPVTAEHQPMVAHHELVMADHEIVMGAGRGRDGGRTISSCAEAATCSHVLEIMENTHVGPDAWPAVGMAYRAR